MYANEEKIKEIAALLMKKGWTKLYSSHYYRRPDEALEIAIRDNVLYVVDRKRNKKGVKVATLVLKDIVVTETQLETEFLVVKL